ncbi:MAG: hypothetical protein PVI57_04100 [Gemmatimonadota bacterium]|jgi:hypothetical protein
MRGRRSLRTPAALLAAGLLALGGCGEDGPSGPGTLDGEVRASEILGAVVVRIEGSGIERIGGTAGTRAFVGPVVGESRSVILVGDGESDLRFEIDVQDVAGPRPQATVTSAVDALDEDVPGLNGVDVRFSIR